MKTSIIKEIFHGERGNMNTMIPTPNKEYLKEVSEMYNILKENFSEQQLKLVDNFFTLYCKDFCDNIDFYFTEGFKLGLRIAVESFENNK